MDKKRYAAYDAANNTIEEFNTLEEAQKYIKECEDEGFSEECEDGQSWIAEITHRTCIEKIDAKEDYCECCTEECGKDPDTCGKEEWPYDSGFDYVGKIIFEKQSYE